ncbi:MAG: GAF domain-containing sensor histidine kinase [Desulfobacterales bacterium]|jgi:signal transduction histidine kinase
MDPSKDAMTDNQNSTSPEAAQAENERRLFHLKTLYDVSHELLGVVDIKTILKNFLLMTLGNFGVVEGILLIHDPRSKEACQLVTIGVEADDTSSVQKGAVDFLTNKGPISGILSNEERQRLAFLPDAVECAACFSVDDECAGVLGLGSKIVGDPYSDEDRDLLETLLNNLIVALKNARSTEALKNAYDELAILNRAKDKLIHHLSHELQTPVAVLKSSVALLQRKLASVPPEQWQRTIERAQRHLQRLADLQFEVVDILKNPVTANYHILSRLISQCTDELEVLIAEQTGDTAALEPVRHRIEELFGPRAAVAEDIVLSEFVQEKINTIKPQFSHRHLDLIIDTEHTAAVHIPSDPLEKLITGLVKNAIEYTPDEGKIELAVKNKDGAVVFSVHDHGVGIVEEHYQHIFEGFFPTQETNDYSSKKPFDFNAGGKGADLLRLKIFSERYDFHLDVSSARCRYIPLAMDVCPGQISRCQFCKTVEDCYLSGETRFTAVFPTS